jgi:DNA-binding MarR family transcriptional regulator
MTLTLIPAIHRATHRIGLYLAELNESGLAQGEAHILALLVGSGSATVGDLHKGLAHKRSTLTSILDRLVDRAFVTRETAAADRRTSIIRLTKEGERVARRVQRHLIELERAVTGKYRRTDLDAFMRIVSAVEDEARRRTSSRR